MERTAIGDGRPGWHGPCPPAPSRPMGAVGETGSNGTRQADQAGVAHAVPKNSGWQVPHQTASRTTTPFRFALQNPSFVAKPVG